MDVYNWGPTLEDQMHIPLLRPIFQKDGGSQLQDIETQMYLGNYVLNAHPTLRGRQPFWVQAIMEIRTRIRAH